MIPVPNAARRRHLNGLGLVSAALLLGACAGSPATRYFTLSAVAPPTDASHSTPSVAYRGPPVEVRSVQIPPSMDRLEMVRELSPGQLDILDFDHWAAPLGRLARQAITEDLTQRLPKDKVAIPGASWPEGRAPLTIDILSFRNADGAASMELSWALRLPAPASTDSIPPPAQTGSAPLGGTLRVEMVSGSDASATAQAWSALLAKVADRIAGDLSQ